MARGHSSLVGLVCTVFEKIHYSNEVRKGTGKTYLIQHIIQGLRIKYNTMDDIGVTSSTGVLSLKIGGELLA
jgi:hypothetical protein